MRGRCAGSKQDGAVLSTHATRDRHKPSDSDPRRRTSFHHQVRATPQPLPLDPVCPHRLLACLILCASSTPSASSSTTSFSVPRHLLKRQYGPKKPICSRYPHELIPRQTDHPCSSRTLLTDEPFSGPLVETRKMPHERLHHQHGTTSEKAHGGQGHAHDLPLGHLELPGRDKCSFFPKVV